VTACAARYTLVFFHAHPDDEAILTAGSMAKASAAGHRVVLAVATAGERGLATTQMGAGDVLAARRLDELHASARALGCHRVVSLGYADSGMSGETPADAGAFANADVEEAARRLARLLDEERADVMTVYDPAGGYGHPDHVQVHRVGSRAARLATKRPVVLEATFHRERLQRAARLLRLLRWLAPGLAIPTFESSYTSGGDLTHRIDVRAHVAQKRAAMAAHRSQTIAASGTRSLELFLKLPMPVYRAVFGHEWYAEQGLAPPSRPLTDMCQSIERRRAGVGSTGR
jgi:LmbE family N-acetylglucosaminyl deacetylase